MPGLEPNRRRKLSSEDLLAVYNSQAELVHSLQGAAIVHGQGGRELNARIHDSKPTPAEVSFRAPGMLRMTGEIPFSAQRTFDLASDGREFRLLVPDGKWMRFFVGPVDAPATSDNPRDNLRPQPILAALRWFRAKPGNPAKASIGNHGASRTLELVLIDGPDPEKTALAEFDLHSGTIARLSFFDSAGQPTTEVDYSDWQPVKNGAEENQTACFPRRMYIKPSRDTQVELKFLMINLNVPVGLEQFRLLPPHGISVTRIGGPAGAAKSSSQSR